MVAIEAEKIKGLMFFRGINQEMIFEEAEFETVCAYERSSDEIRIILQNVKVDSPNEEELVFVRLVGSNGKGLPVDSMKSGHKVTMNDMEIEKISHVRSQLTITVSSIKLGKYKLSSENKIEIVES
jgi:hypothetical protein